MPLPRQQETLIKIPMQSIDYLHVQTPSQTPSNSNLAAKCDQLVSLEFFFNSVFHVAIGTSNQQKFCK
jgi:hypothetical protein